MGLLDKLFGKTKQSEQDVANKRVRQKIFNEVTEFDYSDFCDLRTNNSYERVFAGNLKLTTGEVVCTDPMYRELGLPQSWSVKPGDYPVYLYIALNESFAGQVAYAELNITGEIPVAWELSLIPETLLADNFEKKMNGLFPVENGLGCFSDFETWKTYNQEIADFYAQDGDGNYYNSVLEKYFIENVSTPTNSKLRDWINYKPIKAAGNIIMFSSGGADGLYPRYVGFDKNRQVVKLIADFIQLTDVIDA